MSTKKKSPNKSPQKLYKYALLLIIVALACVFAYHAGAKSEETNKDPSGNTIGYVVAEQASSQAENFYKSYMENTDNAEKKDKLVELFGTKELVFYNKYYQHSFDPIVCSDRKPTDVSVVQASPGTEAIIKLEVSYDDGTKAQIGTSVVINNDGLRINSVTCPADKADLPPKV